MCRERGSESGCCYTVVDIGKSDGSEYSMISSSLLEGRTLVSWYADEECLVCERGETVPVEAVARSSDFKTVRLDEYLQQMQVMNSAMRERMRRPPRTTVTMR